MDLGTELALGFVIIGILMLLAEAASPGSFILVPASVLLVIGLVGLVYPSWLESWWTPIVALIVMVPMTIISIKLYQRLAPPAPPETVVATSLVGQAGVVTTKVEPNNLRGKVRIDHDSWSATSDHTIPVGAKVIVKSSEGVHVKVIEVPEPADKAI